MTLPQGANQRWSLDFVSDVLADQRQALAGEVVDNDEHSEAATARDRPRTMNAILAAVCAKVAD
jgi:hypothetical protein